MIRSIPDDSPGWTQDGNGSSQSNTSLCTDTLTGSATSAASSAGASSVGGTSHRCELIAVFSSISGIADPNKRHQRPAPAPNKTRETGPTEISSVDIVRFARLRRPTERT